MPRDFYLSNPTYDIPKFNDLRQRWKNVPDERIREIVVAEEQYLKFFNHLLLNLRHTAGGCIGNIQDNGCPLVASIRAVAIKSELMIMCSIMEAVLLAHAVNRHYCLPRKECERSFGKIIEAWEKDNAARKDLSKHLGAIKYFKSFRDNFHLTKTIRDDPEFYEKILKKEELHLAVANRILDFLTTLESR